MTIKYVFRQTDLSIEFCFVSQYHFNDMGSKGNIGTMGSADCALWAIRERERITTRVWGL